MLEAAGAQLPNADMKTCAMRLLILKRIMQTASMPEVILIKAMITLCLTRW
ncbi:MULTISPECIES: hypothetical protein [Yersiniaceae]|uniref:hypothetical protein n=1 Tax=Yersiniaceae TaxID=1903411 RepID=UPI0013FCF903|nr:MULTISPECIES: hypothetical protein [Yersiniaceae]MDV5142123.1 hypothetical protein [Chimaeribacter arupi]